MRELIWYFLSIGGLLVAVLVATFWLRSRPHSAQARRFLSLVVIPYAVLTIYGIGEGVGRLLVVNINPLAARDVPPGRTAIVVLGSGGFTARDWTGGTYSIVDRVDAARVLEAVRVFAVVPNGSSVREAVNPDVPTRPGVTMRDAMSPLGIPARGSRRNGLRSTHDETVIVSAVLGNLDVGMSCSSRRARTCASLAFIAQGIRAILPSPATLGAERGATGSSDDLGLWKSSSVIHEIMGLVYYTARGWYKLP